MITLQNLLEPAAKIDWLHTEQRALKDQAYSATGPRTVIPTAIFTVSAATETWEAVEW
jgi:hypothetical protein